MKIRSVRPEDKAQWLPLWQGYLSFYKVENLPDHVTESLWARFFDAAEPVHALVAEENG
jgi:hypothetical protein